MPSLFGRDGSVPDVEESTRTFQRAWISAEFRAFAANESSPVTQWLRALARLAHEECGSAGVGAIGMCFTGNFALTMMLESAMLAGVLSQPALPLDDPGRDRWLPRSSRPSTHAAAGRPHGDGLSLRCRSVLQAQRFAAYTEALGERFVARVLPDTAVNPVTPPFFEEVVGCPHSVVGAHLIDEAGQPTIAARDEILSFLTHRLVPRQRSQKPSATTGEAADDRLPAPCTSAFTAIGGIAESPVNL